jgi:hypothetical protein
MRPRSGLLACGLALVFIWPAQAQVTKAVIQVTGGEMP